MEYEIIGYPIGESKDSKNAWLHSRGYWGNHGRDKAQARIDNGDARKYLMPEIKDHVLEVVMK